MSIDAAALREQLVKKIDAELDALRQERLAHVDYTISLIQRVAPLDIITSTPPVETEASASNAITNFDLRAETHIKRKRTHGLRDAARDVLKHHAPSSFTKEEFWDLFLDVKPEFSRASADSARSLMTAFLKDGLLRIVTPANGRTPAVYEKVTDGQLPLD